MRLSFVSVAASVMLLGACATSPGPHRETANVAQADAAPVQKVVEPVAAVEPAVTAEPAVKPVPETPQAPLPVREEPSPVEPAVFAKPPAKPPVAAKPKTSRPVPEKTSPKSSPAPIEAPAPAVEADSSNEITRVMGTVELVAGAGQTLTADEMSQVVVYFVPDSVKSTAKPGRYLIYTHNKQFEPESLVVPLGSTVSFPNQDEILHNVFSVTPKSSFDLGVYGEGKSAEYTFKKAGLVLINCNVHHAMQANVLVVDTPYIVSPGKDGRFSLDNLPAGSGKLMLWHPRANVQEQAVRLPMSAPISLRMVLSKPRFVEHVNKERKPY